MGGDEEIKGVYVIISETKGFEAQHLSLEVYLDLIKVICKYARKI